MIVFDNMIADKEANRKLSPIVTELFLKAKKLNISLVFTSQSYLKVSKTVRLNATHYSIMKIPNKRKLQRTVSNYLFDIEFKDFMNVSKDYTKETFSFLVNDTILRADNRLSFRTNRMMEKIEQNKTQHNLDRQTAKISANITKECW